MPRPTSVTYILTHATLFLVGIILILYAKGSPILAGVGTSLIAAGIAGWVIFVYVLTSNRELERAVAIQAAGLRNIFPARSISIRGEYDMRIDGAKQHADVVGFGLSSLREDHLSHFAEWKRRVPIRILLIDPDLPYASERDLEEQNPAGTIAGQVHQFVRDTKHLLDDRFQIRLYRCLPLINMFRIDDDVLWGPFLVGEQSRNTPTFLCRRGGFIFDHLVAHFEAIWNDAGLSRAIPQEWIS